MPKSINKKVKENARYQNERSRRSRSHVSRPSTKASINTQRDELEENAIIININLTLSNESDCWQHRSELVSFWFKFRFGVAIGNLYNPSPA